MITDLLCFGIGVVVMTALLFALFPGITVSRHNVADRTAAIAEELRKAAARLRDSNKLTKD